MRRHYTVHTEALREELVVGDSANYRGNPAITLPVPLLAPDSEQVDLSVKPIDLNRIVRESRQTRTKPKVRLADHSGVKATSEFVGTYVNGPLWVRVCGSRFSFGGWRCGVQILFLLLACCADHWQNIGGYVAWIHHLTHGWHKLIARR
jgi:hypothetical protein